VSIPSNIAEGFGRHFAAEYVHHLRFSNGSNNELQTQLELGRRLGIVTEDEATVLIADVEEVAACCTAIVSLHKRRGLRQPGMRGDVVLDPELGAGLLEERFDLLT